MGTNTLRGIISLLLAGLATCAAMVTKVAVAQPWPAKNITVVVPLAAGTGMDALVRLYSERLSQSLGKPVIVDNRTGGSGTSRHRAGPAGLKGRALLAPDRAVAPDRAAGVDLAAQDRFRALDRHRRTLDVMLVAAGKARHRDTLDAARDGAHRFGQEVRRDVIVVKPQDRIRQARRGSREFERFLQPGILRRIEALPGFTPFVETPVGLSAAA